MAVFCGSLLNFSARYPEMFSADIYCPGANLLDETLALKCPKLDGFLPSSGEKEESVYEAS